MFFKSYATTLVSDSRLIFGAFGRNTLTGRLGAFFAHLPLTSLCGLPVQHSSSFLDYVEDICLAALSDPPQTLNLNTSKLPYTSLLPLLSLYMSGAIISSMNIDFL